MSDDTRTAEQADQWLRSGKPAPTWIGRKRELRQETTIELLSRIADLKTELHGERERADRLEVDLALAQSTLRLVRREETLRLRDRAGLAAFSFLAVVGFWVNIVLMLQP